MKNNYISFWKQQIDNSRKLSFYSKFKKQYNQEHYLTFRPFLATYFIFEKVAKNDKKVRLYIALTFRPFLATYFIFEKVAKNDKKVRL